MVKIKKENKTEKLLKENLRELTSYIGDFWDFIPMPIILVNPLNIILSISKSFERMSGYNAYEIVGESLTKVIADKNLVEDLRKEIAKKEEILNQEALFLAKGGEEIKVNLSAKKRRDEKGDFIGYFLTIVDISEIKALQESLEKKIEERTRELEEAKSSLEIKVRARTREIKELADNLENKVKEKTVGLVQSKEALINILEDVDEERKIAEEERKKTMAIIENFSDGLLVFDEENRLSLINPQAEDFFNVKTKDLIGKSVLELSIFPALKPLTKILGKTIRGVFREELPIEEKLTLEVSTVTLKREQKKIGTLVILHDVTREKIVERMKTEFVSLAAHQLRTPLSAIKWTLRMLLDGDLGVITKEQREFIEKSYNSNERMISLINDLLDITRIEEGRFLYKPVLTDIESIVQFVVDSYQEEVEKRKLKLEFKKPQEKLPRVMLDIEKMRLVIQNLLDNAVKYTPSGGRVTICLKSGKKKIEISVKDTGVGVPKDQQERVFTKFFRGANVMRMETEGTGLGLFISKNIIEAHGGKIWFESGKGEGTIFYFTIPVPEEAGENF